MSARVAFLTWTGDRLPYADNLVNLIVCDREELAATVTMSEITRVLVPGGVACIRRNGKWIRTVKPRPDDTDEWTHFLHGPDGNAVAHDTVVAPPRRVQWIAPPRHTRGHESTPSIAALVSAAGRVFYIADEAPIDNIAAPAEWRLVARDAYNGLLLWKRPMESWYPYLFNWGSAPPHLQRRVVAAGTRVYVTLGLSAPVSVLDAATGKTLAVYEQTRGAMEIVLLKGVLLVVTREVTPAALAEQEKVARLARRQGSPLFKRETAAPLLKEFRQTEFNRPPRGIVAVDVSTGKTLWRKPSKEVGGVRFMSLSASGDQAFYQVNRNVISVDLRTGKNRWSMPAQGGLRLVSGDLGIMASKKTVSAFAVHDGRPLWSQPLRLCSVRDFFVIRNTLWLGGFKPFSTGRKYTGPVWGPYFAVQRDLRTGDVLKEIKPKNPGHHHRCWRNKATDRFIIGGRRGAEFIDLETGDVFWNSWVRGVCRYGTMPANGLLYAPPHACGCYISARLDGFYALSGQGRPGPAPVSERSARLETGPAFPDEVRGLTPEAGDWPTYRHDSARSGAASGPTSKQPPSLLWKTKIGGRPAPLTIARGMVFTVDPEGHRVYGLDAATGRVVWHFAAAARVDSPPTFHNGRIVFGCRDGRLYALRARDGVLAWRLRLAPERRLIMVRGQVEAASPVFGSVLLKDGVLYATAGRSSYLDGGIVLYRVAADTGRVLSATVLYSPDPKTGRQPEQKGPSVMPGARADILSSDADFVYLRDTVFDLTGARQPKGRPHLFTLTGFLDDTWPHRSYWCFATRPSLSIGCGGRERHLVYGRLLTFDSGTVYGYGRANVHWSNMLRDGAYRVFAVARDPRAVKWQVKPPVRAWAMVLAGDTILVCGPETVPNNNRLGPETARPARVLLVGLSTRDGAERFRCALDSAPVFDGMAVAGGRIYVATTDGQIMALGAK
ncbi:MAG: PQQ-binding-like beta-propeller repeat protein [Kiritimatiellaeota bacterium]|nr:PQQ-binding-like beta-propeller repeat protein [Kiritimatiellota bacterium]